jgi:hypothetical protein
MEHWPDILNSMVYEARNGRVRMHKPNPPAKKLGSRFPFPSDAKNFCFPERFTFEKCAHKQAPIHVVGKDREKNTAMARNCHL